MKMQCGAYHKEIDLVARILLAIIFFMGGVGKFMDSAGTVGYMQAYNVPAADLLVWPAAAFLIVASILLVVGYKRCMVAGLLAAYTLLVTLIFHNDMTDQMQMILALKNLAIIGGLLLVMNNCKGSCGMGSAHKGHHDEKGHDHQHDQ